MATTYSYPTMVGFRIWHNSVDHGKESSVMLFFRRNKKENKPHGSGPKCTACGSSNTQLIVFHGTDSPDYVRVWRGQRVLTYRCLDCGKDFYADEPVAGMVDETTDENRLVDDEEALRQAEEELKRQTEEDDDRTCR